MSLALVISLCTLLLNPPPYLIPSNDEPKRSEARRLSDSATVFTQVDLRSKRIMEASSLNDHRPESSHQDLRDGPPLDVERAKLSLQHVRALNTQFASWVQSQLQNHLDELWIDGVKDYLSHAFNTLGEFQDIVDWLRKRAAKSQSKLSTSLPSELASDDTSTTNITSSNVTMPPSSFLLKSTPVLPSIQGNSVFVSKTTQPNQCPVSNIVSSEVIMSPNVSLPQTSSLLFSSQSLLNSKMNNEFSKEATSASLPLIQNSNLFSSLQSGSFFSTSLTTSNVFPGIQNSSQQLGEMPGADEEGELEQPTSPSLKKVEEKGVSIVHEVKCKVYIKDNPTDNTWKDMGTGNLSIKCKEDAEKATRESKPTIICRNDAGKILLNALIYPGIKMSLQKTSIVSIFHTTGVEDDNSSEVVARPYLIRLKSLEDAAKLAETIKEYAPSE